MFHKGSYMVVRILWGNERGDLIWENQGPPWGSERKTWMLVSRTSPLACSWRSLNRWLGHTLGTVGAGDTGAAGPLRHPQGFRTTTLPANLSHALEHPVRLLWIQHSFLATQTWTWFYLLNKYDQLKEGGRQENMVYLAPNPNSPRVEPGQTILTDKNKTKPHLL